MTRQKGCGGSTTRGQKRVATSSGDAHAKGGKCVRLSWGYALRCLLCASVVFSRPDSSIIANRQR